MPNKRSNRKIGPFDILGDKIWTCDPLFVELDNIQISQIKKNIVLQHEQGKEKSHVKRHHSIAKKTEQYTDTGKVQPMAQI